MAWYDDIGNTVGGFFGQEDDRLRELRMQNSADFNIAGNSEQAQMLAEQDKMFEDNATFDSGWDLKGMAKSFLGDESGSDSKKSSTPSPKAIAGKQMDLASLAPQQMTNPALKAVQGFGGFSNGGFGQQANAQKQASLFERMMGIA